MSNKSSARLIYSDSERGANMRYATGLLVPDEFLWLQRGKQQWIVVSKLEFDRVRAGTASRSPRVEVLPWERFSGEGKSRLKPHETVRKLLESVDIAAVEVPEEFPLGLATRLRDLGIRVEPVVGEFFPQRQIKSEREIAAITQAQRQAEVGLSRGLEVLRASRPTRSGELRWRQAPLTSERLRGEIDSAVVRAGGQPSHTIVAGGDQACDPHERGHGVLRARELIILDIFPRDSATGYFGDLTRTVVRGKASDAARRLYETVREGQQWVLGQMRAGADGARLHEQLVQRFAQAGYPTEQRDGRWAGFFHGTGHSLGLEIHEPPRFAAGKFRAGQVMTVEPGLYYVGVGGVRLEDLVVIGRDGVRNLTKAPFELEL